MMSASFDALKFSKTLQSSGIPEGQANAQAEAIKNVFSEAINNQVATKTDIYSLKDEINVVKEDIADIKTDIANVKTEITSVRSELKEDIANVKTDIEKVNAKIDLVTSTLETKMVRWMLLMTGGIIAVMKLPIFN